MIQNPFIWTALSFTAGILLQPFYSRSFFLWPSLFCVLVALFFLRGRKIFWVFLFFGFVLLGMIYSDLDHNPQPSTLKREIEIQGTENFFAVTGKVNTEPEMKIYGRKQTVSFTFETRQIVRWEKTKQASRKRVRGKMKVFLNQPGRIPEIGDTLRLWGRFEVLPSVLNPGGFNYQAYLKAQDIDFLFNSYGPKSIRLLESGNPWDLRLMLSRMRQAIRVRIQDLFDEKQSLLIRALILGDRKNLKGALLEDFLKTGTTHLLAISGLNISMVAGSFYLVLIMLQVSQKKAALLALFLAMIQTAVGGFGVPVQRAGIMACLGFLSLILERERSSLNLFLLAYLVLLLADTRNLQSISFQLSFLSLFCLILFTRLWNQKWSWAEAWASSAAVLTGTFPVVLYHFSTFSPIGIAANVLAVPLFHFVLLTACLSLLFGGVPWLGFGLKIICSLFLKLGLAWIHFCASADWGYYFLPRPSTEKIIFYYASLAGLVVSFILRHPKRRLLRVIGAVFWCSSAVLFFIPKPGQNFRAVFFSAGSNEAAYLAFGSGNHWLINSGRTFPGDQAQWILQPYLRSEGIKDLKGILFTDYRKRHTAGFETLRRSFRFQYRIYPVPGKGQPPLTSEVSLLGQGDLIHMPEGGRVEILSHSRGRFLFRVRVQGRSMIFLPDLSLEIFQKLKETKDRKTDILMLPSLEDPEPPLLKSILTLVSPRAVISPRGSPKALVEERGILFFDLNAEGAVTLEMETEAAGHSKILMTPYLFPEKKSLI